MANAYKNKVIYNGTTLIDISDTTAVAANVDSGTYFYLASGQKVSGSKTTYTVTNNLTHTSTANANTSVPAGNGYYTRIKPADGYLISSVTVTMGGVDITSQVFQGSTSSGDSAEPTLQTKTVNYTPSETAQSGTVTADSGYDGLSSVTVSVGAVDSEYVGSDITRRTSSDLTASGATVSVPAGYYSAAASKSVASGSAGTPTATKGTVSNHAITVTPSVTNVTGYITGGTKTGTAVSVSASELVSGSQTITENGTVDVTNLASVVVDISSGGGSGMNLQVYNGIDYARATSYTATDVSITVAVSGTYTVSWIGWRSTSSGTSGSQLYINGSSYGSAYTSFTGNYGQNPQLTNVSLSAGDVLVIRARSRSTSYYMYVGNLIIEQTA